MTVYRVRNVVAGGGVIYISKNASLRDAAIRMVNEGIGCLIVVDEEENPVGIITKKDIIYAFIVYSEAPKREIGSLASQKVEDHMSRPLITVDADEDLRTAIALMKKYNISHLPVVDEGRIIGVLSDADIVDVADELLELLEHQESGGEA